MQWHKDKGIEVTAYSPLANTNSEYQFPVEGKPPLLLENEVISNIAKRRGCTNAQVVLAWGMGRDVGVIVRSSDYDASGDRIQEKYESWQCELQEEDFDKEKELGVKPWRFRMPLHWHLYRHLFGGLDDAEPHDY